MNFPMDAVAFFAMPRACVSWCFFKSLVFAGGREAAHKHIRKLSQTSKASAHQYLYSKYRYPQFLSFLEPPTKSEIYPHSSPLPTPKYMYLLNNPHLTISIPLILPPFGPLAKFLSRWYSFLATASSFSFLLFSNWSSYGSVRIGRQKD